jgi:hypothetical protein
MTMVSDSEAADRSTESLPERQTQAQPVMLSTPINSPNRNRTIPNLQDTHPLITVNSVITHDHTVAIALP